MHSKQLSKPPIKEAIISVSFKNVASVELLNSFRDSTFIKKNYPIRNNLMTLEVKSDANVKNPISTSHKHEGFLLSCGVGCNKSIQSKIGQLSFHNTDSYMGWESFYDEFKKIWQNYCETVGKMDVTQLGVRYINQLYFDLPLQNGFEEFLKFLPIIPEGINRSVNNFFIQLNVPNENNTLTGIITETLGILPKDKLQVILDLNVIKAKNFVCNSDEMWASFNDIRNFKNHLFFKSLTDKAIKQYE
jgi:uncharacterized protein (TIGR04255 family)